MPVGSLFVAALIAQRQQANPFAPPQATVHYAPDRTCDLKHVSINLDVDYPTRTFSGRTVSTLVPLRSGLTEILLHAGAKLSITKISVNGNPTTKYRRDGKNLFITVPSTVRGTKLTVGIVYKMSNSRANSFGGEGGFHWIEPRPNQPATRVGFWTQGESEYNNEWAPTWDYPNDFATYDETYTVQADWTAIGNGRLVSETLSKDKKKKTFVWKQEIPHATYLLTAVGGPFDIKKTKWEDVPLWYVVPKGQGKYIDDTFGHTPDMLTFFSKRFGFRYPWAKYAQNAMYDFGGGMENVSATTLGEGSLTEARAGFWGADSLVSHELGHQWFGDTVTCKDWGDIFLNESFATLLQMLYFEHSRGLDSYLWEVENNTLSYLSEARRYKRPVSTKLYPNADAMFDSHTYPKGGNILHTLRRMIGDEAFFGGLKLYLNTYKHTPVQNTQLERSFTEASGINVEWFFDQWFRKPGHPVIAYDWKFDNGNVTVTVKQTQDTADGTPIYKIPNAKIGVVAGGRMLYFSMPIDEAEETFKFSISTVPSAVVFDPEHDFLRVLSRTTAPTEAENIAILNFVQDPVQRTAAVNALVASGTEAAVNAVVSAATSDRTVNPALLSLNGLANLKKAELRSFWLAELKGANAFRKAGAVRALAQLPADAATTKTIQALVNDKEFIPVVVASIQALATWDKAGNKALFQKAAKFEDRRGQIARAANSALE